MYESSARSGLIEQLKNKKDESAIVESRPLERYEIDSNGVKTIAEIIEKSRIPQYRVLLPKVGIATCALLTSVKERLLDSFEMGNIELFDPAMLEELKKEFNKEAGKQLAEDLPNLDDQKGVILS